MVDQKASRKRQEKFMRDFGANAMRQAVLFMFDIHGPDWLTDAQMNEIVNKQVSDWRRTAKMNRRNRKLQHG